MTDHDISSILTDLKREADASGNRNLIRLVDQLGLNVQPGSISVGDISDAQMIAIGTSITQNFGSYLSEATANRLITLLEDIRASQAQQQQPLPDDLISDVIDILEPCLTSDNDLKRVWTEAFKLFDPRLMRSLSAISNGQSAYDLSLECADYLLDWGCIPGKDVHSLSRLLTKIHRRCAGVDQEHVNNICALLDNQCGAQALPPVESVAPTPPSVPTQSVETPETKRTPTVFISYSHQDADTAERLMADLQANGHACWIDTTKLKGGSEWMRAIADGINNSYALVVLASHRSLKSRWVQDEIIWARQKGKPIYPVLLEDVLKDDGFFSLVSYQAVDIYTDYSAGMTKLLADLPAPTIGTPATVTRSATEAAPMKTTRDLELEYLDRLLLQELLHTEKYTAMAGTASVSPSIGPRQRLDPVVMRPEFEHRRRLTQEQVETRTVQYDDIISALNAMRQAVLLGEPGAGKTTTLFKLAKLQADAAIDDPEAPLPLLVRLGFWTDPAQPIEAFLSKQTGLTHLTDLLAQGRVTLLLDGLNEIPVEQQAEKAPQVRALLEQYPELMVIVTSRVDDYTGPTDLNIDQVLITPLDPIRIREFVTRYLTQDEGEALFWKLATERTRSYYARFEQGRAHKLGEDWQETFWLAQTLPNGMTWYWWEDWKKVRQQPGSMMQLARNPYMLFMMTDVYMQSSDDPAQRDLPENRGQLFAEFTETLLLREELAQREGQQITLTEEGEALLNALAELAFEMQTRRAQATDEEATALTALPRADVVPAMLNERQMYLASSTSILDAGDDVRFTHQLLQEYLAATRMRDLINAGQLDAVDIWPPDAWWQRTNWEEATILLAGLYSDDCTPVLNWVQQANPEVAALCVLRSGASTPDDTLLHYRELWLPRLPNAEPPPARAAVGRALGQLSVQGQPLDNRAGVGLDETGLPALDWVEVPAGRVDIKEQTFTVAPFQMAKYPVTYTQYQSFVEAADGYANADWWRYSEAAAEWREKNPQPRDARWPIANHPREQVSWYEAVAFCHWLSAKTGDEVRLPTEWEWQWAAAGDTGWDYPYGDTFDAAKGNTSKTGIGQTSAVGIFPQGTSPFGVLDMSGNVWEWCLNEHDEPEKTVLAGTNVRVRRGGGWSYTSRHARVSYRSRDNPDYRFYDLGFRVARFFSQ